MGRSVEYDETTLMRFGKHKGKSIKQIIDTDPDYLIWFQSSIKTTFSKTVSEWLEGYKARKEKSGITKVTRFSFPAKKSGENQ